jgi:hypothetical protein
MCLINYILKDKEGKATCNDCPIALLCAWYSIMLEDEELGKLSDEEKVKFSELKDFINRIQGDLDKLIDINNQLRKIMFEKR